jgi:hypothetical protein
VANASVGARLRGMGLAVWHFVSGAPLTYGWLFVLLITTIIQHQLPKRQLHAALLHRSTNIHALATDPLDVLFSSLCGSTAATWSHTCCCSRCFLHRPNTGSAICVGSPWD